MDKYTLLLTSFNYDGNGADTFFWAGAANRPGPQGFIVPDEDGKYVGYSSSSQIMYKQFLGLTFWIDTLTKISL